MPCVVLTTPHEPDVASVYAHTTEIVAMPAGTYADYVALVLALKQRVAALSSCFEAVKGEVQEAYP